MINCNVNAPEDTSCRIGLDQEPAEEMGKSLDVMQAY
ncbi:uncharacterized protein METZ01_LOCUS145318 [marine metagenome]|uniref:Uncharacterized protein n=1 Tax=marine metagenome TaxID=408172 RepID=A0A381ZTM7_9ZZZZ